MLRNEGKGRMRWQEGDPIFSCLLAHFFDPEINKKENTA